MSKKLNMGHYLIVAFIIIQLCGNLLFLKIYSEVIDYPLLVKVGLFNALLLGLFLLVAYTYGINYHRRVLGQSNLNINLYNLIQNSTNHTSLEALYQDILTAAVASIPTATKGCVMLLNDDQVTLSFVSVEGYDAAILKKTFLRLDESYLYRESNGKITKSVVIHDPFDYDRKHITSENMDQILSANSENIMTTISTPIIIDGALHGMINVDSPLRNAYNQRDIDNIEIFAYEITNVIRLHESLEENTYLSTHDILTGIYNRLFFNQYFDQLIDQETIKPFTLISMDLNHLKGTNDTYGHSAGDALLKQFTLGFTNNLPDPSCFARYGGDEFLLVLPEIQHDQVIDLLLNVKKWFISHPLHHKDIELPIDFSYGIAHYPNDHDNPHKLFHIADERMYQQKRYHHKMQSRKSLNE